MTKIKFWLSIFILGMLTCYLAANFKTTVPFLGIPWGAFLGSRLVKEIDKIIKRDKRA